jgi:hypothetical protein
MFIVEVSYWKSGVIYDQTLDVSQFIPHVGLGALNVSLVWKHILNVTGVPALDILSISAIREIDALGINVEAVATNRLRYQAKLQGNIEEASTQIPPLST